MNQKPIPNPVRVFDTTHNYLCFMTQQKIGHIKRLEDKINANLKAANSRIAG